MKNTVFFFSLLFLISFSTQFSYAQSDVEVDQVEQNIWPDRSTNTIKKGRKVWPLFGVKKLGASKNMEWHIQPIFFFVSPNLGLKKNWKRNNNGISISSFHQINYPSIYLKLFSREGAGGVLPLDSKIPPMISLRNEIMLGLNKNGNLITLRIGIATIFKLGSAEKNFPDIDYPFLYNRTLAFNNSPNIYLGINFNRDINPKLNLEADFTTYSVGDGNSNFVHESKLVFFWKKSDKFGIKAGAAAAHGQYPFGKVFQMIPVFDVLFGFGGDKD